MLKRYTRSIALALRTTSLRMRWIALLLILLSFALIVGIFARSFLAISATACNTFRPLSLAMAKAYIGGEQPVSERSKALLTLKRRQLEAFAKLTLTESSVQLVVRHKGAGFLQPWLPIAWQPGIQENCNVKCTLLNEPPKSGRIDAIIDNEPCCRDMPELLPVNSPNKFMVAVENYYLHSPAQSGETLVRGGVPATLSTSLLRIAETARWISSYELDAQVPLLYLATVQAILNWRKPVSSLIMRERLLFHTRIPAIAVFVSNCKDHNFRAQYIRELSHVYPVHHYGACKEDILGGKTGSQEENLLLGNWTEGEGGLCGLSLEPSVAADKSWKGQKKKISIVSQYRYLFSFENSIGLDYVTEKVYEGMASGAVPIYWGAPNIRDFIPRSTAIIHAKDFNLPRDLGEYLHRLDSDENLWLRHHAWRSQPIPRHFLDLQVIASLGRIPFVCRLCACVAGHLGCASDQDTDPELFRRRHDGS